MFVFVNKLWFTLYICTNKPSFKMKINKFSGKGKSLIYFTTNLARRLVNIYFPFKCNSHRKNDQQLKPLPTLSGRENFKLLLLYKFTCSEQLNWNELHTISDICNFPVCWENFTCSLEFSENFLVDVTTTTVLKVIY